MKLLTAHRILIGAALALALIMGAWGASRREWPVVAGSAVAALACAWYLRRLLRDPPVG